MTKHPAKIIDTIYILSDLLIDASRVLEGTYGLPGLWRDLPEGRADELEGILKGFDFLTAAKAVRSYADTWQSAIDAEAA